LETRLLIVNADDFGLSAGINRGIVEAHQSGIVTSTSLMVRWPAAREAARLAVENPALSVGLHVDLGEWVCDEAGEWKQLYEVCDLADERAVKREIWRQLHAFRAILGKDPSHIDSHQHIHRAKDPFRSLLVEMGQELGVPVRHHSPVRYCGHFWGQNESCATDLLRVSPKALCGILRSLPRGVTELACHPGHVGDFESTYAAERGMELHSLCHPSVRDAVGAAGIELINFHEVGAMPVG
jgi:chitin disaccharide deacetylase